MSKPDEIAPAFEQAKQLMAEYQVPVVVEIILERVTNIAMGTEIDNVTEFEDLAEGRRTRRPRSRCSTIERDSRTISSTASSRRTETAGRQRHECRIYRAWASWAGPWPAAHLLTGDRAMQVGSSAWHHGPAHGEHLQRAARAVRDIELPRTARRARGCARQEVARGRRHDHDGARHAARGGGAVRQGRRGRGPFARQDRGRHELDLADRDQGLRPPHQRARLRLSRRAGLRRRRGRQGGVAHDHGRRLAGGVRQGQAAVRADGQEHHAGRRQRRRADHQGRQPDHRRADHRGGGRGAAVRLQGRAPTRPRCARR